MSQHTLFALVSVCALGQASSEQSGTCRLNRAFVFVKPDAVDSVPALDFVRTKLQSFGINIVREGDIDAKTIERDGLIDDHYGAIASKAVKLNPSELQVSQSARESFHKLFDQDYLQAV